MADITTSVLTILYTLKSLLLYSLSTTIVLTILYYPGFGLFKLFSKKFGWNISAFLSTYIISVFSVIIIYFIPYWFLGAKLLGYDGITNKLLFFAYLVGLFLLYALFLTLVSQLFVFLGAYLAEKFKFKSNFLKVLVSIFIIAVVLNVFVMIFPWSLGGILTWIWF